MKYVLVQFISKSWLVKPRVWTLCMLRVFSPKLKNVDWSTRRKQCCATTTSARKLRSGMLRSASPRAKQTIPKPSSAPRTRNSATCNPSLPCETTRQQKTLHSVRENYPCREKLAPLPWGATEPQAVIDYSRENKRITSPGAANLLGCTRVQLEPISETEEWGAGIEKKTQFQAVCTLPLPLHPPPPPSAI